MRKVQVKEIFNSNQENIKLTNYDFINYLDTSSITMNHIDNILKLNIGEETIPSRAKRLIKKDTIVYSLVRPNLKHYGIIRNPLDNMVASTGFITLNIKDKTKNDANYMYYNLTQDKYTDYLHTIACNNVSSYPSINPSDIEDMEIEIEMDINNQKKIAKLFVDIDKKIELNNKINSELENIAKTLYDYWFVQFDFPDENERPYKSSGGKMVYNEKLKREIPKNWSEGKLFDYIENEKGGDWGKDEPQGNYSLQVKCFRGADIPTMNTCCISEVPIRYINKNNSFKILSNTDIIIEISGGSPVQSTGRIAYINNELLNRYDSNLITSNFCKAVSLKSAKYVYNFYLEWKTLYNQGVFFNYEGKTTGIKNLLYDDFINSYKTVVPDKNTIEKFYKIVEPIFNQIQINCKEAIRLIQLRDFLLPMLMNGQATIQQ